MDYEQKYNKALEIAKDYHDKGGAPLILEVIFPELKDKESKDEQIRKAIMACCSDHGHKYQYTGITTQDMMHWLEKQSENTLDADKVIEWLRKNICTACYNEPDVTISQRIDKFKKDFRL